MGSELDVKIFFLLQPAGVGQGVATPLVGAFYHHFLQSLSDRFLMRQQIPFGIDFYVRQRGLLLSESVARLQAWICMVPPAWTQEELESHRLAFRFVELRPVGDASPLSLHWGRRATYHIPIVLDYAAARSPNQADQSDPENKRHCEREQGASPLFFIHVYICENWPRKGSRGSPLS